MLHIALQVFHPPGMHRTARTARQPEPNALAQVQVQLLTTPQAKTRARRLLAQHHYLGDVRAVGEQLW
jgi:hypothetical protein